MPLNNLNNKCRYTVLSCLKKETLFLIDEGSLHAQNKGAWNVQSKLWVECSALQVSSTLVDIIGRIPVLLISLREVSPCSNGCMPITLKPMFCKKTLHWLRKCMLKHFVRIKLYIFPVWCRSKYYLFVIYSIWYTSICSFSKVQIILEGAYPSSSGKSYCSSFRCVIDIKWMIALIIHEYGLLM